MVSAFVQPLTPGGQWRNLINCLKNKNNLASIQMGSRPARLFTALATAGWMAACTVTWLCPRSPRLGRWQQLAVRPVGAAEQETPEPGAEWSRRQGGGEGWLSAFHQISACHRQQGKKSGNSQAGAMPAVVGAPVGTQAFLGQSVAMGLQLVPCGRVMMLTVAAQMTRPLLCSVRGLEALVPSQDTPLDMLFCLL